MFLKYLKYKSKPMLKSLLFGTVGTIVGAVLIVIADLLPPIVGVMITGACVLVMLVAIVYMSGHLIYLDYQNFKGKKN